MRRLLLLLVSFVGLQYSFAEGRLHIDYAGDLLTEKERQQVERMADYQIEFFRLFGLGDSLSLKITVFDEWRDSVSYIVPIQKNGNNSANKLSGVYMYNKKELIIKGMKNNREKGLSMIYHQLSHYFTREITGVNSPAWLIEGLGEYFKNCEVGKKGIKHSMPLYEKGRICTMYMLGEVNLRKFVDADIFQFMKRQKSDEKSAYILAHSVVTFMIEKVPHQVMDDLIGLLQNKTDRAKVSEKIARVYPGGFEAFETDFEKFCE